jgi:hypothetical protein
MNRFLAGVMFGALLLGAQEPVYFPEPERSPWRPSGELLLELDRLPGLEGTPGGSDQRLRALLQVEWAGAWELGRWDLAIRGATGSDGNRLNTLRYDQRPSNGAWLHRASVRVEANRARGFGSLTAGLQGNELLSQESLWDRDLGVLGLGARWAFRDEARGVLEAGLRAVAGRVRTFPGAQVDLRAVQAVYRGEGHGLDWTLHAGWWEVRWNAGEHRFAPVDPRTGRQTAHFEALGAGLAGAQGWGWEFKAYAQRNRASGDTGTEFQAWMGPARRTLRPRFGLIHQRYGETGTPAPVNGDAWWFVRGAAGPRAVLLLPLPGGWGTSLSHLTHRPLAGDAKALPRTVLSLTWRF